MCSDIYSWPFLEWQVKSCRTDKYSPKQHPNLHSVISAWTHLGVLFAPILKLWEKCIQLQESKMLFYLFHAGADVDKHSPVQVRSSLPPVLSLVGGSGRFGGGWTQSPATPTELHPWPLEHGIHFHTVYRCFVFNGGADMWHANWTHLESGSLQEKPSAVPCSGSAYKTAVENTFLCTNYYCYYFWCRIIPGILVFSHPWPRSCGEAKPCWYGVKENPLWACFLWAQAWLGGGCGLLLDARDAELVKQGTEGTGAWTEAPGDSAPAWASNGACCLGHWWLSFCRKTNIYSLLSPPKTPVPSCCYVLKELLLWVNASLEELSPVHSKSSLLCGPCLKESPNSPKSHFEEKPCNNNNNK